MKNKTLMLSIALSGTVLEWAEYTFYAYMATTISNLFFPQIDPRVGIIATFGVFAAGYLLRPVGALLFGYIGDVLGRKKALVLSMFLMSASTLAMGLLPTYSHIGILAPLLLICCRCIQGVAIAGEFNGASVFLIEHANSKNAHFVGSWAGGGAALGMLIGGGSAAIVSLPIMAVWAWRIPFFLGFFACLFSAYLRTVLSETPEFVTMAEQRKKSKAPLLQIIKNYKHVFFIASSVAAFISIYIYICNLYYASFLLQFTEVKAHQARFLAMFGQAYVVLIFPIMGIIADRFGGLYLMRLGLCVAILAAPTLFLLAFTNSIILISVGQLIYAVGNAAFGAPAFKFLFDLFPTALRYSATSFSWSLSAAIFGGTAPLVASYLAINFHFILAPPLYVVLSGILTFKLISASKGITQNLHYQIS